MRNKKLLLTILLPIILLTFYFLYKHYFSFTKPIEVSQNMQFKIDFQNPIIFDDSTIKSIVVEDTEKTPADAYVFLSTDKKSILVNPPIGGYIPGKKYSITVSPEIHFDNYKLKDKKYIPFIVLDNKNQPPTKINKKVEYSDIIGVTDEFMGYKYNHYGIYLGNNKVIHYISTTGKVEDSKIQETDMDTYFKSGKYFVLDLNNSSKFTAEEVIKRAKSRLGENSYDLLQNNCEHFVFWSKTGDSKSYQIDTLSDQQVSQLRLLISMGVHLQY
ncbi:lecithin retinol acyltransferase family protein [Clostridium sp. CX1]|uniref:lecithin retinol acyltransferase family protein n=1 Tax=Clostridium sp. CX1 TaxID=2978346 RepID=UPI0021C02F4C|nr:lecithin retinol acyltransferase family protein [Clostridium sp. CX1]MCT8978813.1 lecithin retinol acyltransferase family protein [Clostridium sp. CX1]